MIVLDTNVLSALMRQQPDARVVAWLWFAPSGVIFAVAALALGQGLGTDDAMRAASIFAFVGVGSLLGAVAGAGLAKILVSRAPASSLVLAAAILFALTALGPALLLRGPSREAATAAAASWAAYVRQTLEMSRRNHWTRDSTAAFWVAASATATRRFSCGLPQSGSFCSTP